jgi:PHD/YefM family antitoxin component YafN of YafNO toxin-antitoxin module
MSLTAPERETVIVGSDADDGLTIWTAQRPVITKLKNNPAAVLLEEGRHEGPAWARFSLPADLLSFRTRRRQLGSEARERLRDSGRRLAASQTQNPR